MSSKSCKSCRFCLAVKVKVFVLGDTEKKRFIENVLKQSGYNEDISETHYICYECHALLDKSYKFILRVVAAQMLLCDLVKSEKKITVLTLKQINREKYGLGLVTNVLKNIDIQGNSNIIIDHNNESIKKEDDNDMKEINSDIEDCTKVDKKQFKKRKNPIIEDDPTFNPDMIYAEKKKKKNTKSNVDTENMTKRKPVKYNQKTVLQPSKFILSLANVPDKRERHKTKSFYELGNTIQEPDSDFQPDSRDESSDCSNSSYYSYDDSGKRVKKSQKREYPRKCDDCDFEILVKKEHYRHYMISHRDIPFPYGNQNKPTFVCQFCGKISKGIYTHIDHELTHNNHRGYQCLKCPKKFHNRVRLLRHVSNSHPKKILECDYCSKKIKTREELLRHIRTHTGEKPFKCHICNAGFAHKGNVRIHIRANHEQENKKQRSKKPKTKPRSERKYSSDDSLLNLLQLKSKLGT